MKIHVCTEIPCKVKDKDCLSFFENGFTLGYTKDKIMYSDKITLFSKKHPQLTKIPIWKSILMWLGFFRPRFSEEALEEIEDKN